MKSMNHFRAGFFALALLLAAGCDAGDPGTHQPEPVVEAWLVAGRTLPDVTLTWTEDVRTPYNAALLGIENAQVEVRAFAPDGSETVHRYAHSEMGVYEPLTRGLDAIVHPSYRYDLRATVPGHGDVTSSTLVPGDFEVLAETPAVVYQATDQVEIDVTPSSYPGRQAIYMISIVALEPSIENLTPFALDAIYEIAGDDEFDPSDLDPEEIEDALTQTSPPLNEANWEVNPDGSLKLKMPWFFVAFYGENRISANAIDDNIYDFYRYLNAQEGNGGLSPGEIPNIKAGVVGGHGVFGSMTRIDSTVDILRENG